MTLINMDFICSDALFLGLHQQNHLLLRHDIIYIVNIPVISYILTTKQLPSKVPLVVHQGHLHVLFTCNFRPDIDQ